MVSSNAASALSPSLPSAAAALSRWSLLRSVEERSGVPAVYLALALLLAALLALLQGWGMRLLTAVVGLLYPLYCSLRALSSSSSSSSSASRAQSAAWGTPRLWLIYW